MPAPAWGAGGYRWRGDGHGMTIGGGEGTVRECSWNVLARTYMVERYENTVNTHEFSSLVSYSPPISLGALGREQLGTFFS